MRIEIAGPVGRLAGELEEPDGPPRGLALVCHPHPARGGSMRNTLVVRVARGLRAAGMVTLRFDFRGVGGSDGVYDGTQEIEDAAAAAAELTKRHAELPLWAAGYSFGARIAAELAVRDDGVQRLLLLAFPCRIYDPRFLGRMRQPGLIILGENDSFGNAADLRRALPELPAHLELVEIPGADHFFRGRTPLVEEATVRYARRALET
jgi:alpha/beta superfamily hydrolase